MSGFSSGSTSSAEKLPSGVVMGLRVGVLLMKIVQDTRYSPT